MQFVLQIRRFPIFMHKIITKFYFVCFYRMATARITQISQQKRHITPSEPMPDSKQGLGFDSHSWLCVEVSGNIFFHTASEY